MKRCLVLGFAVLMFIGLILTGFGFWCLGTTSGTRWLMATAGSLANVSISTTELEGSLLDGLAVKELRVAWNGGEIQAGTLRFVLDRFGFWSGDLAVKELAIKRLVLQIDKDADRTPPAHSQHSFSAESLAFAPEWLEIAIDRLELTGFVIRNTPDPSGEVVIANLIAGRYRLTGHRLVASNFSYHSPYVELDGEFDWLLAPSHLVMTANVKLPDTCVDPALFKSIAVPVEFPGHFELDGDWNGYSGPVQAGFAEGPKETVWLSTSATGSWSGIRLDELRGRYLGGELTGNLDLAWIDSYRMHGQISAQEIEPASLVEGITGKTTFDATGELLVPYNGQPLQAKLSAMLHEGRFRGHALRGRAAGEWLGQTLVNLDVDLTGDGAHLVAKGVPARRVDVDLEVAELNAFHTDLAGRAAAAGWLSWSNDLFAGEINGQGENLRWQEIKVGKVEFQGRRLPGEEDVALTLSGNDWSRGEYQLQRVAGELSGTLSDHQFKLAADGSVGHFTTMVSGSYLAGHWSGQLERLRGDNTPWGRWSMPQPTPLSWDKGVISIDHLRLDSGRGAHIDLLVEQWGSAASTNAALTWSGFDLIWLQPYVAHGTLEGRSDGHLLVDVQAGRPVTLKGQVSARGQIEEEGFVYAYDALDLDFTWDQGGLSLSGAAKSGTGEDIQIRASAPGPPDWTWAIDGLVAELKWQRFNLARLDRFLEDGQFEGSSDGHLSLTFAHEQLAKMYGHLSAQGRIMQGERELGPRSLQVDLAWEASQFQCTAIITGKRGGQASLQLASQQEPSFSWPDAGQVDLEVSGLSLAALEPLLPHDIEVDGTINGSASGTWNKQGGVDLSGQIQLGDSKIGLNSEDGKIILPLHDAVAGWSWADDSLTGTFALNLAEHGSLKGTWQLPLPARVPTAFDPQGQLHITIDGQMQAIGVLSAIGPWLVQDIRGETEVNLAVQGSWAKPDFRGKIMIKDGAAYLPVNGVQLEDFQLQADLVGDRLRIDNLSLHSGSGHLTGQGEVIFDRWQLSRYRLDISGKDLQVYDFPELQMTCDPDLTISGNMTQVSVKGSMLIPRLAIRGSKAAPEILSSKDVVLARAEKQKKDLNFAIDMQVVVDLGDDVTFKSGGVDTSLAGGVIITMGPTGELLAQGEIQLVSGSYRAHGVNLKIRQGVLTYKKVAITKPDLRIFAAREVGDVLAGVQVTGNAEAPVVTLYSQPAMPERDILGYMLMGRAISTDNQGSDILMMGAGSLLPGYGGALSELGITEVDIQGLFEGTGGVRLRRPLSKKWEVESTLGVESGVDLFYIIEFD